jgi:hypothetical protein
MARSHSVASTVMMLYVRTISSPGTTNASQRPGDRQRLPILATDREALCEYPSRAGLEIGCCRHNRAAFAEGLGKHGQLSHRLGARMDRLRRAMIARRRSGHQAQVSQSMWR